MDNQKRPKILIVDDDKVICELYTDFLQQNHFEVLSATSANDALELMRLEAPDLVVSDIYMPKKNGFQFFEEAQILFPSIPFIFMTGYEHDPKTLNRLQELQKPWISKPMNLEELLGLVTNNLR
jgi:DNA-binding NtrC family response regulator